MNRVPKKTLLAFKRLNLAGLCFDRAGALAKHILDTSPDPTQLLYSPMVAGVVVTYMRPFVSGNGLGPLPQDFSTFADTDLHDTHQRLVESRHKLYAHQDLQASTSFPTEDGGIPFDMEIEFSDLNGYTLKPGAIEVSSSTLEDAVQLCNFQRQRVSQAVEALWPTLTADKTYAKGSYKVGLNFP
jgi:hypothetical protein